MPTTKSAAKRMRTSKERHVSNLAVKNTVHTARRNMQAAIAAGDKTAAETVFRTYCSAVDKAVKKGVLPLNAAARRKSRARAKIEAVQ